jgi:nucleoside-diphosphate-sugar epimerase
MSRKTVLVTGMSGVVGGAVLKYLRAKYHFTALNRRDVPGVRCVRADMGDLESIKSAFLGQDVVVHLAAVLTGSPWEEILHSNIIGCYNVFEASRQAEVRRIVLASSGATVWGYENDFPYSAIMAGEYERVPQKWPMLTAESAVRPHGLYGSSKVWAEALGRYYSEAHGLSVICLRYGRVRAEDRPVDPRDFSVWCSQRDAAQMVERSIEAPESLRFDIFYVVSNNRWRHRDIEHARKAVGFEPQDSADHYLTGSFGH